MSALSGSQMMGEKKTQETLKEIHKEICSLYIKIKRCSKDTNMTESNYLKNVETDDER